MKLTFSDSYYYMAFISVRDAGHEKAQAFSRSYRGKSVTTEWVLTEVADAFCAPEMRGVFLQLLSELRTQPGLQIVEATHDLFERGLTLFAARPDKAWSLTDCISFVVMQDHGITEALTADRHFEQAGFAPLLA
jgi:predicted nucleic acid-binding protein